MGNADFQSIFEWLEDTEREPAVQKWKDIYQYAIFRLWAANIPFSLYRYIPSELLKKSNRETDIQLSDVIYQPGIILEQVRYIDYTDDDSVKTKWLIKKEWKNTPKKKCLVHECQWTLRPLSIIAKAHSLAPKEQKYLYKMMVSKYDKKSDTRVEYAAWIATRWDGSILKQAPYMGNKNALFPHRFVFPKHIVSKINRCLFNNFLPQLRGGPPCAAWHRTDEGRAFYLGCPSEPDDPELGQQLRRILNGPNGDATYILLAYSCFSILKPFFPSYHTLHKDDSYFDVKKRLPEQLAICIQSDCLAGAERLVDICCGYFRRFESSKESKAMPIIDGISIQKSPSELKKLGVTEFERKIIQPACVLWVNREPAMELIENGSILGIHISSPVEDDVGFVLSEALVYILALKIHKLTTYAYEKRLDADWEESAPQIERFLEDLKEYASLRFGESSQEYMDVSDELPKCRDRANFNEPLVLLKQIKFRIISEIERTLETSPILNRALESDLKNYRVQIQQAYEACMRELKRIHNKNMRLLYSLDPAYRETVKRLLENPTVSLMGRETVKKVAYLSTSFQIFYQYAMPTEYHQEFRDRVEASLIVAYQRQLGAYQPQNILEDYILGLLKKGQCARIRGKESDDKNIRVWYDPDKDIFLIPSKDYFDRLKNPGSISKRDFENALVNASILCTVQRKNQARRTFETVVRKGGSKLSVLKINVAALSARFSKSAQKYLEQMKTDETPYRFRRS